MNRNTTSDDTEESLTQVDVDDLTRYELREVIPACDFVVLGYDSSYSDADVTRKRVDDPVNTAVDHSPHRHLSGVIHGDDHDDPDRAIGFGKGDVYTSSSSGRIGHARFVEYPAPEPDKTRYTVTFRSLTGNWSARGDHDDPDYVDDLTESTVEERSYDDVEMPPKSERRIEDVPVRPNHSGDGVRNESKCVVDVPVTLIVADVDTTNRDEVVDRAFDSMNGRSSLSKRLRYRDDLPGVHDDANEVERGVGMGGPSYVRENTRYIIEDVEVEAVPVEGGTGFPVDT